MYNEETATADHRQCRFFIGLSAVSGWLIQFFASYFGLSLGYYQRKTSLNNASSP
jgi:hypothetical protein